MVEQRKQGRRFGNESPSWLVGGGTPQMKTSEHLEIGRVYTREDLKEQFGIADATIKTSCLLPKGHHSRILARRGRGSTTC